MTTLLIFLPFLKFVSSQIDEVSLDVLKGASMGVYIECKIDRVNNTSNCFFLYVEDVRVDGRDVARKY